MFPFSEKLQYEYKFSISPHGRFLFPWFRVYLIIGGLSCSVYFCNGLLEIQRQGGDGGVGVLKMRPVPNYSGRIYSSSIYIYSSIA